MNNIKETNPNKMTVWQRLNSPSPKIFVKIQNVMLITGTLLTGIGGVLLQNSILEKTATVLTTAGAVILGIGTVLAKLPVDNEKINTIDDVNNNG